MGRKKEKAKEKGKIKVLVYYDGLCEPHNPKRVANYGFVVHRDGAKIGERKSLAAQSWSCGASNNVREYRGLIVALEWLLEHGYEGAELLVRGDG